MKVRLVATEKIISNYEWSSITNCAICQMLKKVFPKIKINYGVVGNTKINYMDLINNDNAFHKICNELKIKPQTFIAELPDELEQYANPDYIVSETTTEDFKSNSVQADVTTEAETFQESQVSVL